MISDFDGAKAAVFIGQRLLVYLRDDKPGLPYAGHWDFPGGGREGVETPEETLCREIDEEFGLAIPPDAFRWRRAFSSAQHPDRIVWFFVLSLSESAAAEIRFGNEGQRWDLMTWEEFQTQDRKVPSFEPRMALWIAETGGRL